MLRLRSLFDQDIEGECDLFLRCFTRIEIFSPKKAFLNWPPYGISSGAKWAPRRRGLSFFLGIVFRLAITSPMKNSAQLSKRTGNWPKPSRVDLKNLYYRETESYSA
jgi:hypothetical protein